MQLKDRAISPARQPSPLATRVDRRRLGLLGGGTDGNEQLTAVTGIVLVILLAVIGVTILRIGQLIWLHLFVGLVLMGPVVLKMASTGYRFFRYYTGNPAYRHKGPPEPLLRAIAPLVVLSTVGVFLSGLLLLFGGASSRDRFLVWHKGTFIVWIVFTGLHVLAHLPNLPRSARAVRQGGGLTDSGNGASAVSSLRSPGEAGRWIVLASALVAGLVLAIVLIPDFHSWQHAALLHHHDG